MKTYRGSGYVLYPSNPISIRHVKGARVETPQRSSKTRKTAAWKDKRKATCATYLYYCIVSLPYLYCISTVSLLYWYRQLGAKGFMPCARSSNQGVGTAGQPARAPALYLCQSEQSPSLITPGSHGMTGLPDIRHRHRHRHRRRRSGHLGGTMTVQSWPSVTFVGSWEKQAAAGRGGRKGRKGGGGGPCSP
jgi:hypothetical protein